MKLEKLKTRQDRAFAANQLIETISTTGRQFFNYPDGKLRCISFLAVDERGRVWFHNALNGKKIYTHYKGSWRGFSEGGTLRRLIEQLRDYITQGKKLYPSTLGPWPDYICQGDLWGYKDDMKLVRAKARELKMIHIAKGLNDGRL